MRALQKLCLKGVAAAAIILAAGVSGQAAQAAESYGFDKGHTEIRFTWNHVGLSNQSGEFMDYDGVVAFDPENLANSSVDVTIKAASLDTGVEALDEHLRGPDFFNTAEHPEISFKSTSVRQTAAGRGQVTGDLTINGVTKPVTLDVTLNFQGEHPLAGFIPAYAGAPYVAFSASAVRTPMLLTTWGAMVTVGPSSA